MSEQKNGGASLPQPSAITPATQLLLQTPGKMISRKEFASLPAQDKEAIIADERASRATALEHTKELYSPISFYVQRAEKEGEKYWLSLVPPADWKRTTLV